MLSVEQWAEIRRLYFVKRLSIEEIVRRTGHGRNTGRRALRSGEPPCCRRAAMIDRLVHHAEIVSLKGDSYYPRDRDLGGRPPLAEPQPITLCANRARP